MMADRMDARVPLPPDWASPQQVTATKAASRAPPASPPAAGPRAWANTIRVSLTEHPEKEIGFCYSILQALGAEETMVEYVACPAAAATLLPRRGGCLVGNALPPQPALLSP